MNLKFAVNEYILIWYLLFQQSVSKKMNDYKQKLWKNFKKEYALLEKEKKIILEDPKNYIPDNDIIYELVKNFDEYEELLKQTENYKVDVLKIWDKYKNKVNKEIFNILRLEIKNCHMLLVNPKINIIDLSSKNDNKINTIVYGKTLSDRDIQDLLEMIYIILKKEFKEFNSDNKEIVDAVLELAILNELGTRLTGKSCYLVGRSDLGLLKRQIYPYFLMYLGIDRDDLTAYMRRDGIIFDTKNYTNEIQLRKINLKEFINFCINNQRIILKLDKVGVK
ncbi:MAG: hypothetical protein IKO49_04220 [Bacilli bacterium]|nr:hypothetical protein [Bacilli bacterium]